jgi:hypothetical protein
VSIQAGGVAESDRQMRLAEADVAGAKLESG